MSIKSFFLQVAKKLRLMNRADIYRKNGVKIGKRTRLLGDVQLDWERGYLIEIGERCVLTYCSILAHDSSPVRTFRKAKIGRVTIGNRCFIGYHSLIMPNVRIGDDCIIGAGSVVTKDIPAGSIVAGNPARVIMSMEDYNRKQEKYIKEKPVFTTYLHPGKGEKKKTEKDKLEEIELLKDTWGYN